MTKKLLKSRKDKAEFKKWIEALRSGDFRKGKQGLEIRKGYYCCLGVACKVLIPDNKLVKGLNDRILGGLPGYQKNSPKWLAYIDSDFCNKTTNKLTTLNDFKGFSFDEIADLLELVYIHNVKMI